MKCILGKLRTAADIRSAIRTLALILTLHIAAVTALATLVVAVLVYVNWSDEPLSEEAARLLAPVDADISDDNGYVHLVGVMAPADEDSLHLAREWITTFGAAETRAEVETAKVRFGRPLAFIGNESELCKPDVLPCLPLAAQRAHSWRAMLDVNAQLVERVRRMEASPRYREAYFAHLHAAPNPDFKLTASLLVLDLIALDAQEGRIDSALVALDRRIAYDRRMLAGSSSLISGMVAANRLRRDFALLGEIVAAYPGKLAAHRSRLLAMTQPVTLPEIRLYMVRYMQAEATLFTAGMPRLLEPENAPDPNGKLSLQDWLMIKVFYQPNATLNWYARGHLRFLRRTGEFDPADLGGYRANIASDFGERNDELLKLSILYNGVGKVLASLAGTNYSEYIVRLSDLMAISRLAHLQVLVAFAKPRADVPSLLARDERFFDPYSGKPMQWEPEPRRIAVGLKAQQSQGRPARFEITIPGRTNWGTRSGLAIK